MTAAGSRSGLSVALAILEEVARVGPTVPANGIARALGIPRASAYRVINDLVGEEYLLRHPDADGFVLGVRVVELARNVMPGESPDAAHDESAATATATTTTAATATATDRTRP